MKKLNRRERNLSLATSVVVVVGLLWGGVVEPIWTRMKKVDEEVDLLDRSVVRDEIRERKLTRLQAELADLDRGLRPPQGESLIPWFIAHLRELSQEASFTPSSLRYLRATPMGATDESQAPYAELRFELKAQATSTQLQAFLVRLAASPRHVRATALSLIPRKNTDKLDVHLTLLALAPSDALEGEEGSR